MDHPQFSKGNRPCNMKIYWRSGYEKHRLIFIAYVLEGLSCNSRCYKQEGGVPNRIAIWSCWNENIGGRNALDLLYLKTSLWSSHLWGVIQKQPAITKQTLKDVSNKYKSVFLFIP